MNSLQIPCKVGEVSDGYHTFNELYEHRCTLFLVLMLTMPEKSWISTKYEDGTILDEWFIAGIDLTEGTVSYHLPINMWSLACKTTASILDRAPKWDGHTSSDVVKRLTRWINK